MSELLGGWYTHGIPYPVHQSPDGIVSMLPQLLVQFHCRQSFLGTAHERHGHIPCHKRQFRVFHYRSAAQGGAEVTATALPLPLSLEPIMLRVTAFFAFHPFMLTLSPEMFTAALFIREFLIKSQ